ncbi:MAG: hypothetical protein QW478_05240 [Candidatus Micrarchaeaceae archaeon]
MITMLSLSMLVIVLAIILTVGATAISLIYRFKRHRSNIIFSKTFYKDTPEQIYNNILTK